MQMVNRKKVAASGMIIFSLIIMIAVSGCLGGGGVICKFDLSVSTTTHVGEYYPSLNRYQWEASPGYQFAIVTIRIVNDAEKSVSTNAFYWTLTVSGVGYTAHTATWDDSIGYQTVDVGKGADFTTKIVYEVPASASYFYLSYNGYDAPKMEQDSALL
jgi:hypothetical protein